MPHTPGPWMADRYGIVTGGEFYCTSIVDVKFAGMPNVEERKANLALVASAPELLEACVWALDALLGVRLDERLETEPDVECSIKQLRDVIAEATSGGN